VKKGKLSPCAGLVEIVVGYVDGRNRRERHQNWGFGRRYQWEGRTGTCATFDWRVCASQRARGQEWTVGR
jgi:hypothetical protein